MTSFSIILFSFSDCIGKDRRTKYQMTRGALRAITSDLSFESNSTTICRKYAMGEIRLIPKIPLVQQANQVRDLFRRHHLMVTPPN